MAKIIGNPTVTPMAVPDWNQTDSSKAGYIKNKPFIETGYYGVSRDDSALLTLAAIKELIDYEVPIVFCSSNPMNMDVMELQGSTAYFYVSKDNPEDSVFLFHRRIEEWYEEEQDKLETYTQTIIDSSGVRVREKVVSVWGVIPTTNKWEWKPLNDYTPTKEYVDEKIKNISPGGGGVTSYNDLTNKPITVLNYYPSNKQLEEMGEGVYLAEVDNRTVPDYLYFFSTYEDWEYECPVCGKGYLYSDKICSNCLTEIASLQNKGVEHKHQSWTVTIISNNGIRVERKDNYRNWLDGRENYTIDWREVPLNENTATKDYVASAIAKLVDSSPDALDTLNELANALDNDPNFATTVLNSLSDKPDKRDLSGVAYSGSYNDLLDKPTFNFSKVASSGDYKDLLNNPITVLENYPSQSELDDMKIGCFIYHANPEYIWESSIMVIAGCYSEEINETPDGDYAKTYTYRQYIITPLNGVIAREKAICDNYADWNYDWKEVPINNSLASKEDIKIKVLNSRPKNDDLFKDDDSMYIYEDKMFGNCYYFTSSWEESSSYEGVGCTEKTLKLTEINVSGISVMEKRLCCNFSDGRDDIDFGWKSRALNSYTPTIEYVGREIEYAIGDIETSLENIIAKYGLGGDSL